MKLNFISLLTALLQAQENDFKLQNKTLMEEITHVSSFYLNIIILL